MADRFDAAVNEAEWQRVEKALDKLPVEVNRLIRASGVQAAAKVVRDQAKGTTAFRDRTGGLRRSIRTQRGKGYTDTLAGKRKDVPALYARVVAGGPRAYQAVIVEYGSKRAPAHPYLEPAVEQAARRAFHAARLAAAGQFRRLGKK